MSATVTVSAKIWPTDETTSWCLVGLQSDEALPGEMVVYTDPKSKLCFAIAVGKRKPCNRVIGGGGFRITFLFDEINPHLKDFPAPEREQLSEELTTSLRMPGVHLPVSMTS